MGAYVTRPTLPSPVPGLVFIYEIFGMNDEMARLADELAAEGYAVIVPNLFSRGSWLHCVRKVMHALKTGSGEFVEDLINARNWLSEQPYTDSDRIAVMGLCMGGGFALLLGKTGLFRVSAPFYGQVPRSLDGICPVVASYGGRDWLGADAERLKSELERRGVPHDFKIYPNAGHGFMTQPANALAKTIGKLSGKIGYQSDAAADAKKRLIAFLETHL